MVKRFVWEFEVMRSVIAFVCLFAASTSPVFGHPGHGTSDGGAAWHYMTSPYHVGTGVVALLVVAAVGVSVRAYRRKRAKSVRQTSSTR